ncbi:MAG: hypothetical protein JWP27_803 [Flaviaesturariibacter sp.]|nr:hypothetical protein [Flaviaesturariibacter sp.]
MKNRLLAAILVTTSLSACKKDPVAPPPGPTPIQAPADDRRSVRLKDIVEHGLPSPLFHFTYNDSGYVTRINYAQDFLIYDVAYESKRVSSLFNQFNSNTLRYRYANGFVQEVAHTDGAGHKTWTQSFTYNHLNQLSTIRYWRFVPGMADSILERRVDMLYHPDGNLASWQDHHRIGTTLVPGSTTYYDHYDTGTCVDDFYIFHNFFEDAIFLPGVQLQRNNPRTVRIDAGENEWQVDYFYSYVGKLPQSKTGLMKQTRGTGNGQTLTIQSTFTYY